MELQANRITRVKVVSLLKWFGLVLFNNGSQPNQKNMGALGFFNFPLHLYSKLEKNLLGLDFWEQCESFLTAPTVTLAVELLMAS